jgi:hypothetical protein
MRTVNEIKLDIERLQHELLEAEHQAQLVKTTESISFKMNEVANLIDQCRTLATNYDISFVLSYELETRGVSLDSHDWYSSDYNC